MPLNPIAFTENVIRGFLRYQLTSYPFADPDLHAQMRRLLSLEQTRRTPLLRGPYVTLSQPFRMGARVATLVAEGLLHPLLENIVSFPHLYGHQERAIREIARGRTTLVSTGTGSGKTECFLYPIISRCLQLRDESAPAGITAVLVYPMNALAEDQLTRLRDLLAGTGVTFGMYVGKTPERKADVAGQRLRDGSSRADYRGALEKARRDRRSTAVHPQEERCSREEMRAPGLQPRILLTNVKQLELLLTRQADAQLFDGAGLEFVVFDEAHTAAGVAGAETACLVRRLRAFCGRDPRETVCVATSATLADPGRGDAPAREFASRFFGVSGDDVAVVSEEYEAQVWAARRETCGPPPDPAARLREILEAVEDGGSAERAAAFGAMTGVTIPADGWREALYERLAANEVVYQIAAALERPRRLDTLVEDLAQRIGRPTTEEEVLAWLALAAAARRQERALLRPVVHAFVRGVGGAVVTFPLADGGARLWLSAEDEALARSEAGGEEAAAAGAVPLPVLTCTTCGQHYFVHHVADFAFTGARPEGGEAVGDSRVWRSLAPETGGRRVIFVDRLASAEDGDDDPDRSVEAHLCRHCGALHPDAVARCAACGREQALVRLLAVRQKEEYPGRLTRCLSCRAPGRYAPGGYREPARPVRAVNVSDVHVLAHTMIQYAPRAERRRLLVFADNRQDAAFQAGWMRDHARRYRLRALMAQMIGTGLVSVGDLTARLDDLLAQDDDLSRTLAPEVWNVHRKEGEELRHSQERKHFLRIQVLREVATGVKQRIGLEPWGRMRADYLGLAPDVSFVRDWAARLGLAPPALADGIAALLDVQRRGLHLLDREGGIFSRFWQDGDHEVMYGYLPLLVGVPRGLKLERDPGDDQNRITQWLSARGDTVARQAARAWGAAGHAEDFVRALWSFLTEEAKILAPVTLTGARGRALPGCSGTWQIDADCLRLTAARGLWRCRRCRRAQIRRTPHDRCLAWRCDGTLAFEAEDPDNYDLMVLDGDFAMVRAREHTAMVPASEREQLERLFKEEGESVNTLVCTPTLELGVDIGALDAVLMRNVPPLPSNYRQRAGRAGRRHRMAVILTYARPVSHDRAYFAEPEKILGGPVEPPRFNMRNDLMVEQHVHATVLTRLHQLARNGGALGDYDRQEIEVALRHALPPIVRDYLFDENGNIRSASFDLTPLRTVVSKHEGDLSAHVEAAFHQNWPEADAEAVEPERLRTWVVQTPDRLEDVLQTLRRRLRWALDQMDRLESLRRRRATLERDEEALRARCDRLVRRLKGLTTRQRRDAEGYDETTTYGVLAAEGFLPGYGLERGTVVATAQMPRLFAAGTDFDLPRPPAVALREYVPGNLIYANGHRFVARLFHLEPVEATLFRVDPTSEAVVEVGSAGAGPVGLAAGTLRAVPICDVDLPHVSHIGDEEEYRFQLAVAIYGHELGRHGDGKAFAWNDRDVLFRKGVHFRLVNVGAANRVAQGEFGYPVCTVCGQSRSPLSSQAERERFRQDHQERCGRSVDGTGFFADVVADAITLSGCANREEAYSVLEALRAGAEDTLDMDKEDLQLLVVGSAGTEQVDGILYDPMPGGSGLLEQVGARWSEVVEAASRITAECPSQCARSCIDCLQSFRNAHYHRHLDRSVAADRISEWGGVLVFRHEIPSRMPSTTPAAPDAPSGDAEAGLRSMLQRAGFPEPLWQHLIPLGLPLGGTTPDCYFPGDAENDPGICIYLDGMSGRIHGNPATAQQDRMIREELRSRSYEVLEIPCTDLTDREAMRRHFFRLGRWLMGRDRAKKIREDDRWFEEP